MGWRGDLCCGTQPRRPAWPLHQLAADDSLAGFGHGANSNPRFPPRYARSGLCRVRMAFSIFAFGVTSWVIDLHTVATARIADFPEHQGVRQSFGAATNRELQGQPKPAPYPAGAVRPGCPSHSHLVHRPFLLAPFHANRAEDQLRYGL